MARTEGFGKREREMLSNDRLPPDVRIATAEFKNQIRMNLGLRVYENRDGGLPSAAVGQTYFEWQVGQAHPGRSQHLPSSPPPGVPIPYPNTGRILPDSGPGEGTTGDPRPRGKRRLVALVDAGRNIVRLYFSDSHYTLGQWKQLQYP